MKTIEQFIIEKKQSIVTAYDLTQMTEYLPSLYKKIMSLYDTEEKKNIALFSSIIGISSILGDYSIFYKNENYNANLFGFVEGTAGSGKTVMRVVEKILLRIEQEREKLFNEEQELFRSKKEKSEEGMPISKPKRKALYIPAANSSSNVCRLLSENNGCGLMYETEADALSIALESKSIGYRNILRNAFDNQTISLSYNSDHSLIKVNNPKLAILISGTPKQFVRLFRTPEDGLLSRFLIFKVRSSKKFSLKTNNKDISERICNNVSKQLLELHVKLKDAGNIYFSYSKEQRRECEEIFQELLEAVHEAYGDIIDGVVFRYGLIFWKVAMQISLVEAFTEEKKLPSIIECTDNAFKFSQYFILEHLQCFIETYKQHFLVNKKADNEDANNRANKLLEKVELHNRVLTLNEKGLSIRRIQEITGIRSTQTIHKIING